MKILHNMHHPKTDSDGVLEQIIDIIPVSRLYGEDDDAEPDVKAELIRQDLH